MNLNRNRQLDLAEVARRHGLELSNTVPLPRQQRLQRLREILQTQSAKFPISPARAQAYYQAAEAGLPFTVGQLSDVSVDLGAFTCQQVYDTYTQAEHLSWACLIAEQQHTKRQYACREYQTGEQLFEIGPDTIPDYYTLNARIYLQTGWQLATVTEIIPAELFFTCHSKRFFPVTTFMRALEQDYLEEPDMGHDVAGHVATFSIPTVANVMQNHGLACDLIFAQRDQRLAAARDEAHAQRIRARADELLIYAERVYWFTVEFGLVQQDGLVRAFGAGILSSPGETRYSIDSPQPNRILLDPSREDHLMRLVATDYLINEFQKTYFVMKNFGLLESLTPERIVLACEKAARLPHFSWRDIVPGDAVLTVGSVATSVNEKHYRLLGQQPMDDCMLRTALRNQQLLRHPIDPLDNGEQLDLGQVWTAAMPDVPAGFLEKALGESPRLKNAPMRQLSFVSDYQ